MVVAAVNDIGDSIPFSIVVLTVLVLDRASAAAVLVPCDGK